MRLLITNDDGIYATGIISLAKRCHDAGHEVTVIAPDRERSACAHSMTMDFPLSLKAVEIGDYEGMSAYSLNGTPADCVKIAVSHVLNEKPDVVLQASTTVRTSVRISYIPERSMQRLKPACWAALQ